MKVWSFALEAGTDLDYQWPLVNFENGQYHLDAYGPNGFYRSFKGMRNEPLVEVSVSYDLKDPKNPKLILTINNHDKVKNLDLVLEDQAYGKALTEISINPNAEKIITLETNKSFGWYDYALKIKGNELFERRLAGRIETGLPSKTEPQIGNLSMDSGTFSV
jgi:phospholipase C